MKLWMVGKLNADQLLGCRLKCGGCKKQKPVIFCGDFASRSLSDEKMSPGTD